MEILFENWIGVLTEPYNSLFWSKHFRYHNEKYAYMFIVNA